MTKTKKNKLDKNRLPKEREYVEAFEGVIYDRCFGLLLRLEQKSALKVLKKLCNVFEYTEDSK